MTLLKWQKEAPARTLFPYSVDFINEFFNDFATTDVRRLHTPAVNISESAEGFQLHLAAPGLRKEDFRIRVEKGNQLLISCEKTKDEQQENKEKFTRKEFSYNAFERRFKLPENVNASQIQATYEQGILLVSLPKIAEEKPKVHEIPIG